MQAMQIACINVTSVHGEEVLDEAMKAAQDPEATTTGDDDVDVELHAAAVHLRGYFDKVRTYVRPVLYSASFSNERRTNERTMGRVECDCRRHVPLFRLPSSLNIGVQHLPVF